MRKPAFSLKRGLVRMSWNKYNLYNLSRLNTPRRSNKTLFQQKWASKKETRGYHGDHLQERVFQKIFEPRLPTSGLGDQSASSEESEVTTRSTSKASTPVPLSTLAFASLEKRLDIVIFRCHFARSAKQARQMCIHGKVTLNGEKVKSANILLQPGDLITVDPSAIPLLKPKGQAGQADTDTVDNDSAVTVSSTSASKAQPMDFNFIPYMQPFLFLPDYLEVSYATCSAVYLRDPLPRQQRSEVPSPLNPESHSLAYEFYVRRRKA